VARTLHDAACRVQEALYQADDSSGALNATGRDLVCLLGRAWADLPDADRATLPQVVCELLPRANDHMFQTLVTEAAAGLGPDGLRRVCAHIEARLAEIGPVRRGGLEVDDHYGEAVVLTSQLELALLSLGEIDAYVALKDEWSRGSGFEVLEIVETLMAVGRPAEALARITTTLEARGEPHSRAAPSRTDVPTLLRRRTECLVSLDDLEGAEASDWSAYQESLAAEPLASLLGRATADAHPAIRARAASIAVDHPDAGAAVGRLAALGELDAAADRLRPDVDAIVRDSWHQVEEVPDQLRRTHPDLTWRMFESQLRSLLEPARRSWYRWAADSLLDCRELAASHPELTAAQDELEAFLQATHGRKRRFWEEVADAEAARDLG